MVPTLPVSPPQTFIEKLLYDRHSARLGKQANKNYWQANGPERDLHVKRWWDGYDTMWQVI